MSSNWHWLILTEDGFTRSCPKIHVFSCISSRLVSWKM